MLSSWFEAKEIRNLKNYGRKVYKDLDGSPLPKDIKNLEAGLDQYIKIIKPLVDGDHYEKGIGIAHKGNSVEIYFLENNDIDPKRTIPEKIFGKLRTQAAEKKENGVPNVDVNFSTRGAGIVHWILSFDKKVFDTILDSMEQGTLENNGPEIVSKPPVSEPETPSSQPSVSKPPVSQPMSGHPGTTSRLVNMMAEGPKIDKYAKKFTTKNTCEAILTELMRLVTEYKKEFTVTRILRNDQRDQSMDTLEGLYTQLTSGDFIGLDEAKKAGMLLSTLDHQLKITQEKHDNTSDFLTKVGREAGKAFNMRKSESTLAAIYQAAINRLKECFTLAPTATVVGVGGEPVIITTVTEETTLVPLPVQQQPVIPGAAQPPAMPYRVPGQQPAIYHGSLAQQQPAPSYYGSPAQLWPQPGQQPAMPYGVPVQPAMPSYAAAQPSAVPYGLPGQQPAIYYGPLAQQQQPAVPYYAQQQQLWPQPGATPASQVGTGIHQQPWQPRQSPSAYH